MSALFMNHGLRRDGNKKLLTMAASSLRNQNHCQCQWRRIHHRYQLHCYPASLTAGLDHHLRTFSTPASHTVSAAQLATNEELTTIVDQFPPGINYAFGYGSGVLRQQPSKGANTDPGMVDIILATENPYEWHKHNLQCHSDHYSLMARIGGPQFVTWLQTNFGAKLYFHPYVDMNIDIYLGGINNSEDSQSNDIEQTKNAKLNPTKQAIHRQIKYGVVSTDDLIQDLIHWDYLYLAGRMHKPIVSIDLPLNSLGHSEGIEKEIVDRQDEIEDAQRTNLLSAVSASLLLQDTTNNQQSSPSLQSLSASQLYNTIASLSYTGDFRMQTGAEDPDKVKKLVESPGMSNLWENKYSDTLGRLESSGLISVVNASDSNTKNSGGEKYLELDFTDMALRKQLIRNLPPRFSHLADDIVGSKDSIQQGSLVLRQELADIVAPAAKSQGVKGFFTAGLSKSWKYALAKLAKGRLRK